MRAAIRQMKRVIRRRVKKLFKRKTKNEESR